MFKDINGEKLKIGDLVISIKGDRFGTPKYGKIYGFDKWSIYDRVLICDTSHGKPKSTILLHNCKKINE